MQNTFNIHINHPQLQPEDYPSEDSPGFLRKFCENIADYLQSYNPAFMASSLWPCQIKNVLNLCFTDFASRADMTVLKRGFNGGM